MEFPQLDPIPMRKEDEPNYDKEIYQPSWDCYCCRDTGIAINAARIIIKGWKLESQKIPVCQRDGCEAGEKLANHADPQVQASLDWRLHSDICSQVDSYERAARIESAKKEQSGEKVIDFSTVVKSLRSRPRSQQEQELAQRNHLESRGK